MKCDHCSSDVSDKCNFCPKCGVSLLDHKPAKKYDTESVEDLAAQKKSAKNAWLWLMIVSSVVSVAALVWIMYSNQSSKALEVMALSQEPLRVLDITTEGEFCGFCPLKIETCVLEGEKLSALFGDRSEGVIIGGEFIPPPGSWQTIVFRLEDGQGNLIAESEKISRSPQCSYRAQLTEADYYNSYKLNDYLYDINVRFKTFEPILIVSDIFQSVKENPIYVLKLGNGKKNIFVSAGVHARENANTPMLMRAIEELCRSYYSCDAQTIDILEKVTVYFMPLVNPDGYDLVMRSWNGEIKTNANGVDINRNFPFEHWGSNVKVKGNFYPGKTAGSELETKAVIQVIEARDYEFVLDIHSRGRLFYAMKYGISLGDMATKEDPLKLNQKIMKYANAFVQICAYTIEPESEINHGEEGTVTDYAFSKAFPTISIETLDNKVVLPAGAELINAEYAMLKLPQIIRAAARIAQEEA